MFLLNKFIFNPFSITSFNEIFCLSFFQIYIFFSLTLSFLFILLLLITSKKTFNYFFNDFIVVYKTLEFKTQTINVFHKAIKVLFLLLFLIPNYILLPLVWYVNFIGILFYIVLVFVMVFF